MQQIFQRRGAFLAAFAALAFVLWASGLNALAANGVYSLGMQWSAPRRAAERLVVVRLPVLAGPEFARLLERIAAAGPRAIALVPPPEPLPLAGASRVWQSITAEGDIPSDISLWLDPARAAAAVNGANLLIGIAEDSSAKSATLEGQLAPWRLPFAGQENTVVLPGSFYPPEFPPARLLHWFGHQPGPQIFYPAGIAKGWLAAATQVALAFEPGEAGEAALVRLADGQWLPSLPLLLAAAAADQPVSQILVDPGRDIRIGPQRLPVDDAFNARPYFYESAESAPRTIEADALSGDGPLSEFQGKVVLLSGADEPEWETPVHAALDRAQFYAQAAASLYAGDVYYQPRWAWWLRLLMWVLVFTWLFWLVPRLDWRIAAGISFALLLVGLNVEIMLLISQSLWLSLTAPLLMLAFGHAALEVLRRNRARREHTAAMLSNLRLELAASRREHGSLDSAFEVLQDCLPDEKARREVHALGLDYERKRHYAKALATFRYLKRISPRDPDLDKRINRLEAAEAQRLGRRNAGPLDTLPMQDSQTVAPRIGRYEIERELGRGAMGVVYLGRDARIGREVAVKTLALSDEFSGKVLDDVKRRFFREAEAAGRLSHPNIVTIYDVGEEDDLAYIAMDCLKGEPLSEFVKEGRLLPVARVMEIGVSVAEALHYAHEQGVVHRDVKPANIVFTKDQHDVKVTDFGVAHITDASQTKTGTILGSPSFMSPEQVAGRRVDGRSDLWSLGVALYQLFTGHLPFTGEPMATLMYRIANEEPAELRSWRPDLPECAAAIIAKALVKDPAERYQTGRGMASALRQCLNKIQSKE